MLLELQHVIKRFHDKELLHIPVWQIHQGQRIGLIGANGCGKTTLLRILQGVCGVEEGVVRRFCFPILNSCHNRFLMGMEDY